MIARLRSEAMRDACKSTMRTTARNACALSGKTRAAACYKQMQITYFFFFALFAAEDFAAASSALGG
jgi:hypothetical protein